MTFAAAHLIGGHDGKCSRPHGHNWRVRVSVACEKLNELGIGIDFGDVKEAMLAVLGALDHRNLNELPEFARTNPTAENIAKYIYDGVSERLDSDDRRVTRVEIWETDTCSVVYRRI